MRKLLNSLYIVDEQTYLSLDGENIVCKSENAVKFRVPFSNIEEIFCFNYLGCSPALMGKCTEYGIPISFISPQGKFLARVVGETKGNILLRREQFRKFDLPPILLAQNTVAAKLHNSRFVIRRTLKDYPEQNSDGALTHCIERLEYGMSEVYNARSIDEIMGIEGNCAKAYFDVFDRLILNKSRDFELIARTKRPPLDRVNAMLSFLYTIATLSCASALESVGLDSYLGFYHAPRPGRNSLACDMVEEIRCIVERLVLTVINLKIITPDDFEIQPSGAVYLNTDGKKKLITKWQERKRDIIMHPYLSQKIPIGLIPYVQSNLLAKYIRGEIDEYPCFLQK